jgi:hypothetical protein
VLFVVPQGSLLGPDLFITALAILLTKNIFVDDTNKIARSISSATDSTIQQSDIDSIGDRCAADLWKLMLTKLKPEAPS